MEYNWNIKRIVLFERENTFSSPFTSVVVSVFSLRFKRLMRQRVGREVRFLCDDSRWKIHLKEIKYFSRHPIHSIHWFISYVIQTLSLPVFLFSSFFLLFQRGRALPPTGHFSSQGCSLQVCRWGWEWRIGPVLDIGAQRLKWSNVGEGWTEEKGVETTGRKTSCWWGQRVFVIQAKVSTLTDIVIKAFTDNCLQFLLSIE